MGFELATFYIFLSFMYGNKSFSVTNQRGYRSGMTHDIHDTWIRLDLGTGSDDT